MIRTSAVALALGLAVGTVPAFLPMRAEAQVPTTQFSPGSTPRNDSRSNPGAPDVAPSLNEPVTQATPGSTPRNDSGANRGAPDVAPDPDEPVTRAMRGATPRDDSRGAESARGGPGTGPMRHHPMQGASQPRHRAPPASAAPDASRQTGLVIGGPDARQSTGNANGAFLGGGGVFERGPDGSLRQVIR